MAGNAKAAAAAANPETRAYVTFLAGDGDDKRVVELAKDLHKVGSAYPLVVAVLPDVPVHHRRVLVSEGCIVRMVDPVHPPDDDDLAQFFATADDYVAKYSRLRIWELVEYERMVYLDAGTINMVENIDKLFELEKGHFYGVAVKTNSSDAADQLYFDAGLFVHEPGMATAKAMLHALRGTPPNPVGDQQFLDLLYMYFREQYKPIPLDDNLIQAMLSRHSDQNNARLVANKTKRLWTEKKMPQFSDWLTAAKEMAFAAGENNLPAMATLLASSAAAGVIGAAASSPAICFGFYAAFVAAIAAVTISLSRRM